MTKPESQHALIIGIDAYDPTRGLMPLKGSVNDAERMRQVLLAHFGLRTANIELLTDAAATRQGILAAFDRLVDRVGKGHGAILFFAGHGSEFVDGETRQQTLVPVDSGRGDAQNRDICDHEIAGFVARLNARTEWVTLLFDCCHSGSLTRDDPVGVRQAPSDHRPPPGARSAVPEAAFVPQGRSAVMLAACRADEKAYEEFDVDSGTTHGAMTLRLTHILAALPAPATWRDLAGALTPGLTAEHRGQHPLLKGEIDTVAFGFERREPERCLTVTRIGAGPILLSGGASHGVTVGSTWRLVPTVTVGEPVVVTVEEVFPTQARTSDAPGVQTGWRAVLEDPCLPEPALSVAIDPALPAPGLRAAIAQSHWLRLTDAGTARLIVRAEGPRWAAFDREGRRATRYTQAGDHHELIDFLERKARFDGLLALPMPAQDPDLQTQVTLTLERSTTLGPSPNKAPPGQAHPLFVEGERCEFRIHNGSAFTVYVTVIEFDVDGSIGLLLPVAGHPHETLGGYPLAAGRTLRVAADYYGIEGNDEFEEAHYRGGLKVRLPDGFPWAEDPAALGRVTYRLIATRQPADFSMLDAVEGFRGAGQTGADHPLSAMVARYAIDPSRTTRPERKRPLRSVQYAATDHHILVRAEHGRQVSPSAGYEVLFHKIIVGGVERGEVGISHPSMASLPAASAFWAYAPTTWPDVFELTPEAKGVPESMAASWVAGHKRTTSPRFSAKPTTLVKPAGTLNTWRVKHGDTTIAWLARTATEMHWFSPEICDGWLPRGTLHFVKDALPIGLAVFTAVDKEVT
ncbi:MAG: caspase family protein [Myxococcales bacterium]|nr:caspase family protein [Myxococcales bacterium]